METATEIKLQELQKEYDACILAIRGYIKDSKTFGFEPVDLKQMEERKKEVFNQIVELENII